MFEISVIAEDTAEKSIRDKKAIIADLLGDDTRRPTQPTVFYNILEEITNRRAKHTIPEIAELVVKSAVLFHWEPTNYNTRVVPIIQFDNRGGANNAPKIGKYGGAIAKFRPTATRANSGAAAMKISFDQCIRCYFFQSSKFETYIAPMHEILTIVGLIVFARANDKNNNNDNNNICMPALKSNAVLGERQAIEFKSGFKDILCEILREYIVADDFMQFETVFCQIQHQLLQTNDIIKFEYIAPPLKTTPALQEMETLCWNRFDLVLPISVESALYYLRLSTLYHKYDVKQIKHMQMLRNRAQSQAIANLSQMREQNAIDEYKRLIWRRLKKRIPRAYATVELLLADLAPADRKVIEVEKQKEDEYLLKLGANKCQHLPLLSRLREPQNLFKLQMNLQALRPFFANEPRELAKKSDERARQAIDGGKNDSKNDKNNDKIDYSKTDNDKSANVKDKNIEKNKNKNKINKVEGFIFCNVCDFSIMCGHELAMIHATLDRLTMDQARAYMMPFYEIRGAFDHICLTCFENIEELRDTTVILPPLVEEVDERIHDQIMTEIVRLKKYVVVARMPYRVIMDAIHNGIYYSIEQIVRGLRMSKTTSEQELKRKTSIYIDIYIFAYFLYLAQQKAVAIVGAKKNDVTYLIDYMINLINSYANTIIRKSVDINIQWIKYKLVEVFKEIGKVSFRSEGEISDSYLLLYDYSIIYRRNLARLAGVKLRDETGFDVTMCSGWKTAPFDKLIKDNGGETIIVPWKIDGLNEVMLGYYRIGAELCFEMIVDNRPIIKTGVGRAGEVTAEDTAEFVEFSARRRRIAVGERVLLSRWRVINAKMIGTRPVGQRLHAEMGPLGRVFDEEGRAHIFKYNMEKRDSQCSVCGIWRTEAPALDEALIRAALIRRDKLDVFYDMFATNCPIGGLHEFGKNNNNKENICAKCGFDGKRSDEYYNKYLANFRAIDKRINAEEIFSRDVKEIKHVDYSAEYKEWVFDFNKIVEIAEFCQINSKLILALGDYDSHDLGKIATGEHIPAVMEFRNNTRSQIIIAYIKLLITQYNQLRFSFARKVRGPLQTLIESISPTIHAALDTLLPSIFADQYAKIEYFQVNKPAHQCVEFCLELLATMCLGIIGQPTNDTQSLREDFVRFFIKQILRGSELRTQWARFNWSLIFPETKETDISVRTNYEDEDEGEGAAILEDSADPMSLDTFDLDIEPDQLEDTTIIRTEEN